MLLDSNEIRKRNRRTNQIQSMEGQPDGDSVNFKNGIINLDAQKAQEPVLGLVKNHPSLGFNLKSQNNSTPKMFVGNDQLMLS